jgi:lipoprotein NlpD
MALLTACASTGPAPVEDLSAGARSPAARNAQPSPHFAGARMRYRVQHGDTLYSIAFRNGVDYRDLAIWNGIRAPYTIYVGQELRLTSLSQGATQPTAKIVTSLAAPAHAPIAATASVSPAPVPAPFQNVQSSATPTDAPPAAAVPSSPAKAGLTAPASSKVAVTPAAVAVAPAAKVEAGRPAVPEQPAATIGDIAWRWPAAGTVVVTYVAGDRTRQGIDIAGKAGDPVRAAAAGTVVYSGNGLIGYGELIIVKHSPAFLSAYGHNRKRLVKEGDRVSAGQTIAEMGSSSASRDALHFEIRKNGKPVNPIDYLPRR